MELEELSKLSELLRPCPECGKTFDVGFRLIIHYKAGSSIECLCGKKFGPYPSLDELRSAWNQQKRLFR